MAAARAPAAWDRCWARFARHVAALALAPGAGHVHLAAAAHAAGGGKWAITTCPAVPCLVRPG
eukprot:10792159-Lingulodinium_polyedra.AAC.1